MPRRGNRLASTGTRQIPSARRALQLLEKLAGGTGNIHSTRHSPLPVFHTLHNACAFAALRAVGALSCVHDLFPVGCLCNLCHCFAPGAKFHRRSAWVRGKIWGVTSKADPRAASTASSSSRSRSLHADRSELILASIEFTRIVDGCLADTLSRTRRENTFEFSAPTVLSGRTEYLSTVPGRGGTGRHGKNPPSRAHYKSLQDCNLSFSRRAGRKAIYW